MANLVQFLISTARVTYTISAILVGLIAAGLVLWIAYGVIKASIASFKEGLQTEPVFTLGLFTVFCFLGSGLALILIGGKELIPF
jgi:hypothetical protein